MRTINIHSNINSNELCGIITHEPKPFYNRSKYILITKTIGLKDIGYQACITDFPNKNPILPLNIQVDSSDFSKLQEGDIVNISENKITVLWSELSNDNALMLTESCNCRCIMCPQPYQKHDKKLVRQCETILDLLKGRQVANICITGGEPTLLGDIFLHILERCVVEHPEAEINVLSNGKMFASQDFAKTTARIANSRTVFCISLHSDIDNIHDEIVGMVGSHTATENGIYNLAQFGANIEIRYVITKNNYSRMPQFAEYLYNYFPFCCHYTFMGMELYGYASKNEENVYIAPYEYQQELRTAVLALYKRGLPISVYNIPFCLCHKNIHNFARQSISLWKNIFLPQCNECIQKEHCAGFFATSKSLPNEYVKPLKNTEEI